jgi:RHS repeat-associated protein
MLRTETRPTGDVIVRTPDAAGRLDTVAFPGGLLDYDYYASSLTNAAGKLSDLRGPYDVDLHFTYDGMLQKSVTWSGDVTGSVAWNYDTNFNKILETVTGATGSAQAVFGYDLDQLLTCASPTTCSPPGADALRLIRSPQHGLITSITLGSTSESLTYNTVGELATQAATYLPSTPLLNITYHGAGAASRDALGRIVQKTEVIGGVTKVYGYTYDDLRRLTDVTVNGVLEEHFEYDANGNRLLAFNATAATTYTGTYDDQDRLISYGPFDYTYTANGELETKTNRDTDEEWIFEYDELGNLLTVGLPNGDLVEYLVDGMGRRVGKKLNGVLTKQWIYRDTLKPVAELDGTGALVSEFVYGSKSNVPDYVRRGGNTYRVVGDHLGSPRYVVNVANAGDVPFAASYTSFGEVTGVGLDWMPFGFAGGIYEPGTGLVRFGARDYDVATTRWASKDPHGFLGGINLYAYASNDPMNYRDATGRDPTYTQCFEMALAQLRSCIADCYSTLNYLCDAFGLYDMNACSQSCQKELAYQYDTCELTNPNPLPVELKDDEDPNETPAPCWDWECYAQR